MAKAQMVFKKAVKLAKTFTGDWIACMKLALKIIWAVVRKGANKMIELVGSPKQVKWANDIRNKYFESLDHVKTFVEKANWKHVDLSAVYDAVEEDAQAHEWIENLRFLTRSTKTGDALYAQIAGSMIQMVKMNDNISTDAFYTFTEASMKG